jgi:hypothetical protein
MADGNALARIVEAYDEARVKVTTEGAATINLPFLAASPKGPAHLNLDLEGPMPHCESSG